MQSLLLSLPLELRHLVYEYVLFVPTSDGKVELVHRCQKNAPRGVTTILESCRQVHAEAEWIFYRINHLRIDADRLPRTSSTGLGGIASAWPAFGTAIRRQAVRSLALRLDKHSARATYRIGQAQHFPALQTLHIEPVAEIVEELIETKFNGQIYFIQSALSNLMHLKEVRIITPPGCEVVGNCKLLERVLLRGAIHRQKMKRTQGRHLDSRNVLQT